jgi:hypothetical protein
MTYRLSWRHAKPLLAAPLMLGALLASGAADARPGGPAAFCEVYPDAATCSGTQPSCRLCHTSTEPDTVAWNDYGFAIALSLWADAGYTYTEESFNERIGAAALAAEASPVDHDGDGVSSLEELMLGTEPGNANSTYLTPTAPQGDPNPTYDVGAYDPVFAFKRISVAYCGRSPTYAELDQFKLDGAQQADLHAKLDACMRSSYWRIDGITSLADDKIRPINFGTSFQWDYRLWRYINLPCDAGEEATCGDSLARDARHLLTADYHVRELSPGVLTRYDTDAPASLCTNNNPVQTECGSDQSCGCQFGFASGTLQCAVSPGGGPGGQGVCNFADGNQPAQTERRVGMLTTSWFHFINTMFSDMPRTTAAQAMRAYVGLDIAKQQGLQHIADEPADVDHKGVAQGVCKQCHMALDGATYAFAPYQGIPGGQPSRYDENRPVNLGLWADLGSARQPYFLDQPVADLVEWAQVASESDYFKRHHTLLFFTHAVGRPPAPDEQAEFDALWQSMETDGYSTPALLHRLIDTHAFGSL